MSSDKDQLPSVTPSTPTPEHRRERPGLTWPIILIGIGVLLLLAQLNLLPANTWAILWRFWPVILILLGIDLLIGRRSTAGAILSALLALAVIAGVITVLWLSPNIPGLADLPAGGFGTPGEFRSEHIQYPLGGVRQATVRIGLGSGSGSVRGMQDSADLIEGDIETYGNIRFDVRPSGDRATVDLDREGGPFSFPFFFSGGQERWDVRLNSGIPLDLSLDMGSGSFDFDLTGLQLASLSLDQGSGSSRLTLPAKGQFAIKIDLGSGSLDITLPQSMAARITLDKGSGSFNPDGRFRQIQGQGRDDGVWETESYAQATDRVDLDIDQGSGSISVR
jgi:hypothetical protein